MDFVATTDADKGVLWAYRLTMNRSPTELEQESARQSAVDPRTLCRTLIQSAAFKDQMYGTDQRLDPLAGQEARDAVIWAFRLLLNRDLQDEADITFMATHHRTVAELRSTIVLGEEFRFLDDEGLTPLRDSTVLWVFRPFCTTPAAPGSFRDFLGDTTRCAFLPPEYAAISGLVQQPPGWPNRPMHEPAEWIGTLRAALEANGRLTVVELGAGWAPWLVAGHNAARRRGSTDIHLMGVEASPEHVSYMQQNLRDNGIDPAAHRLIFGIVGAADGVARFPRLDRPDVDYGAKAVFGPGTDEQGMVEVPCFALTTLLADLPHVIDLIHCDVQGAEADVIGAAADVLDQRARRLVIGTHSRKVEGVLLEHFVGRGWRLEHESVCLYRQMPSGELVQTKDGEQVWRNPRV